MKYDFSGWATKNNILCTDGRTIMPDAFKENDGTTVPLVWMHQHKEPSNVLGHALLENRKDGVYAYCTFNDTDAAKTAKELVRNGDVDSLSIYANQLKQNKGSVYHGQIREVSLVISGANKGAKIDFPILAHGEESDEEAVIFTGESLSLYHSDEQSDDSQVSQNDIQTNADPAQVSYQQVPAQPIPDSQVVYPQVTYYQYIQPEAGYPNSMQYMQHADANMEVSNMPANYTMPATLTDEAATVQDVLDTMNDEQLRVLYYLVGAAIDETSKENEDMRHNVFENDTPENTLSHVDMDAIFTDAKKLGSLREAVEAHMENGVLAHAVTDRNNNTVTYGMADIDYLFPDARSITNTPEFIKRDMDWVDIVMKSTHHTPFSRVKSVFANITMDEARAKGYIKGNLKKDEVFSLLKRATDPQTIYKKQKLDRDDIIDITDFDVVAWIKAEMRQMLDEEIARAILIGDGRAASSDDKISEDHIHSIYNDAALYTIHAAVADGDDEYETAKNFIKAAIKARVDYKGSGNPTLFVTEDMLTDMLLIEDGIGHPMYSNMEELATALRVSKIVPVPVMENIRDASNKPLYGIIVNLSDYNIGADKGGAVNMFDDFDIDYNQQKYLIETRISGALVKPYSAIVLEGPVPAGNGG